MDGKLIFDLESCLGQLTVTCDALFTMVLDADYEARQTEMSSARAVAIFNILLCIARDLKSGLDDTYKVHEHMFSDYIERKEAKKHSNQSYLQGTKNKTNKKEGGTHR